jgi:ferredoxin
MTKYPMTNDARMTNDEVSCRTRFVIRALTFFRHSSLVIRHSAQRRQLLGRIVKLAAVGGIWGILLALLRAGQGQRHMARPRVDEKEEYSFRPPGALAEPEFLSRCIHCYLCQDVCPAGCIQMKPDGESDRHTPYIVARVKGCTLCLKCGAVCRGRRALCFTSPHRCLRSMLYRLPAERTRDHARFV